MQLVLCCFWRQAPSGMLSLPMVSSLMQYSAASFIETINTNSLTMDSDEFVARMVAAGVPDMQLLPQPEPPAETQTQPTGVLLELPVSSLIFIQDRLERKADSARHNRPWHWHGHVRPGTVLNTSVVWGAAQPTRIACVDSCKLKEQLQTPREPSSCSAA